MGLAEKDGMQGFLPFSRASFMLDFVVVAMFAMVPTLLWSISLVRRKKNYALHRRVQLILAGVLLVTIVLFEVDVRLNGWQQYAKASPYFDSWLFPFLYFHLVFAISTTILWVVTVVGALRHFKAPVGPNAYSPRHKILGRLAAIDMCCTALTGVTFHWMAFVA